MVCFEKRVANHMQMDLSYIKVADSSHVRVNRDRLKRHNYRVGFHAGAFFDCS